MSSRNGWFASKSDKDRHVFALYIKGKYIGLYNNQMPPGEVFLGKKYLWPFLPSVPDFKNIDLKDEKLVQSLFGSTNNAWLLSDRRYVSSGYFVHYSMYELTEEEVKEYKDKFHIPYEYQFIHIEDASDNRELEIF